MKRIPTGQRMHMKPIVEVVVTKAGGSNKIMTAANGITTRRKIIEGIIRTRTILNLETVFKRGEISGCSTASAIYVDG